MDFATVENQINDLPSTFKRPGAPYTQWVDALATGVSDLTLSTDGTMTQLAFHSSQYGWLDVWGILLNLPRRQNESDAFYMARVAYAIMAGGGPVNAIIAWVQAAWNVTITIAENFPSVGYVITFPATVGTSQINAILTDIAHVRPAGVPFTVSVQNVGTYLDTVNFLDAPKVTGAYLGATVNSDSLTLGSGTDNAQPLLPTLLLTDPLLNPGLSS